MGEKWGILKSLSISYLVIKILFKRPMFASIHFDTVLKSVYKGWGWGDAVSFNIYFCYNYMNIRKRSK